MEKMTNVYVPFKSVPCLFMYLSLIDNAHKRINECHFVFSYSVVRDLNSICAVPWDHRGTEGRISLCVLHGSLANGNGQRDRHGQCVGDILHVPVDSHCHMLL